MLAPTLRKDIDNLWDRVWSSGITNPLAVVDFLTPLLLLRASPTSLRSLRSAALSGDYATSARIVSDAMTNCDLSVPDDSLWKDTVLLADATSTVAELEIQDRNHDVLGDCFEYILAHLSTAGDFGQFRTPRHIVQFLVEAIAPTPSETVLDPACGTGSFLIAAHEYCNQSGARYIGDESDWTMARIASANLVLHRLPNATVRRRDALPHTEAEADVILANPPFSGTVANGRQKPLGINTNKSELLFLALMLRRLQPNGRAGVVVPFSVVTAPSGPARYLRRQLLDRHNLHAVVELPAGVFRPYSDVRTCLLLWGCRLGDHLLMLKARSDGYSLDDQRRPGPDNDLPILLRAVTSMRLPRELSPGMGRLVPLSEIHGQADVLNPSRFLPPDLPLPQERMSFEEALTGAADSAFRLGGVLQRLEEFTR
ncbi:MAG: class I SAM-dependent DNA methyltransferase [Acidobacteria bacterium]|nr:class I SAM-dependent DNA methyltransferase [Acidobacteriota bacterium]